MALGICSSLLPVLICITVALPPALCLTENGLSLPLVFQQFEIDGGFVADGQWWLGLGCRVYGLVGKNERW